MAKLPVYERQAPLMADIPQLQTPQYAAYAKSQESLQRGLDVIGKYAAGEAEKQVIKEAQAYTVANPITTDQLEKARSSGINPIESALNGGMVWNEAVQKLYGQQASAELTSQVYKHYDSVYDRVLKGELTDSALIQEALESPIKSYYNVLAQVDPDEAARFYNQSITNGSSYYRKALGELRTKELARQDDIAESNFYGMVRQFEIDIQSGIDPGILFQKYSNAIEQAESLFQNSSRKESYKTDIQTEFTRALYTHLGKEFVNEFGTKEKMQEAFDKGDLGKYSDVWNNLLPTQKNSLKDIVDKEFTRVENQNNKEATKLKAKIEDVSKKITEGTDPRRETEAIATLKKDSDKLSGAKKDEVDVEIAKLELRRDLREKMKNKSPAEMDAYVERLNDNPELYPDFAVEIASEIRDKAKTQIKSDPVGYYVKQDEGELGDVQTLFMDSETAQASFEDQNAIVNKAYADEPIKKILTTSQKEYIVDALNNNQLDDVARIDLANNIVSTFGPNAIHVFNEIAPKDPLFAQLGSLAAEDMVRNKGTMSLIIQGRAAIKGQGISVSNLRKSAPASLVANALGVTHPQELQNIYAAADAHYIAANPDKINETDKKVTIDDELYEQSLFAVMGGHIGDDGKRYGGFTMINGGLVPIDKQYATDDVSAYVTDNSRVAFAEALANDPSAIGFDSRGLPMIMGQNGEPYSLVDLNAAQLKYANDHTNPNLYTLVDANNKPFVTINNKPIKVDMRVLQEFHKNQTEKIMGVNDREFVRGTLDQVVRENYRQSQKALEAQRKKGKKRQTRREKIGY